MNKSLMLMFLSFIFNNNLSAEIATGELEEFFISNGKNDRKVRIYYPSNNPINEETTFIIMNDGEELFLEQDSWNGKSWRIDKSFEYPDIFGFAGCLSTHWVGIKPGEYLLLPFRKKIDGDKDTIDAIKKYVVANLLKIKDHRIYFDHGKVGLDYLYRNPQNDINQIFTENNMTFESKVFEGHAHDPNDFGKRFTPSLNYLTKK